MPEGSRAAFRSFVQREIAPRAGQIDLSERFPEELVRKIAGQGYLAPWLPAEHGGEGMDFVTYGLLNEEVGHACASSRSLLTCHGMVTHAVARWGTAEQKRALLPELASGERIAAFALTEPNVGSDAAHPEMLAERSGAAYLLTGEKSWITFGQRADLFLVLAQNNREPTALLVDRDTPGLSIAPVEGLLGIRGAMLADLRFEGCIVPEERLLGRPGFGFSMVASSALDLGRYSVAWGCVGLLRACLEASVAFTSTRRQFGVEIRDHQLVAQKLTKMMTELRCAELLCQRAGELRDTRSPDAILETMVAKYYTSTAAARAAADAVQLHGARGATDRYPVARLYRDAKLMEIIEGSTQIQEVMIAEHAHKHLSVPEAE